MLKMKIKKLKLVDKYFVYNLNVYINVLYSYLKMYFNSVHVLNTDFLEFFII